MSHKIADDLAVHAIAKMQRVMLDATGLLNKPSEQIAIPLLMASACIGYAAGFLALAAKAKGHELGKEDALKAVFEMIKDNSGAAE